MTTLNPYTGTGAGFLKIGTFDSLFRHTNFSDRLLYKRVATLQEAAACGGLAIFDASGTKMVIFAGEALQTLVVKGLDCVFPYPTVTRSRGKLDQVYGSGDAIASLIWNVDSYTWLDFSDQAASWYFVGVVTKMTSLIGVSAALDLHLPLRKPNTFTTFTQAYRAAQKSVYFDYGKKVEDHSTLGSPVGSSVANWPRTREDVLAGWLGIPWHENLKPFILRGEAAMIGDHDGSSLIRQAHQELIASFPDRRPMLNFVFSSVGATMSFSRNAVKAVAFDPCTLLRGKGGEPTFAQNDVPLGTHMVGVELDSVSMSQMEWPPYDPKTAAFNYHSATAMTYSEFGTALGAQQTLVSDENHTQTYSRTMSRPWYIFRNHGTGSPLVGPAGRVPSIGVVMRNRTMKNYPELGMLDGRVLTARAPLAKLGGWDLRPFLSTCLPRLYFKVEGPADQTVGTDVEVNEIFNQSEQVLLESQERLPTAQFSGTKEQVDARQFIDVQAVTAEAWPYDVVSGATAYWNAVYDRAEQLAK